MGMHTTLPAATRSARHCPPKEVHHRRVAARALHIADIQNPNLNSLTIKLGVKSNSDSIRKVLLIFKPLYLRIRPSITYLCLLLNPLFTP